MVFKEYRLADLCNSMKYGKMPQKGYTSDDGKYNIWSGYKITGKYDAYNILEDQIVVVARGVGGTGDVKYSHEKCFLTNLSIALDMKKEIVIPKYVYYFYKIQNLKYLDSGSAQSQITINDLKNAKIRIPDLETQQKIVRILSALDNKISVNNRMCEILETQMAAIFKNYFIDYGPFRKTRLTETELGMIPDGWKVVPLGKAFNFRRGISLTKNEVSENRNSDYPYVVYGAGRDVFGYSKEYVLREPSVLIAAIGAGAGTVSRSHEDEYSVTSNAFYVLPNNEIDYPYEIFTLRNYNFKDRCSGSAQPMLSYGSFSEDKIILPEEGARKAFYDICKPMIEKNNLLMKQNNTLRLSRDTLLPKLMSGEIDIEKVVV